MHRQLQTQPLKADNIIFLVSPFSPFFHPPFFPHYNRPVYFVLLCFSSCNCSLSSPPLVRMFYLNWVLATALNDMATESLPMDDLTSNE